MENANLFGGKAIMPQIIIEPVEGAESDLKLPEYASEGDSGMDVFSRENVLLAPGETHLFKLGFRMEIPKHPLHELGYRWECQVRPRSGISLKTSIRVANSPGTIDNFYKGEVGVILTNTANPVWELRDVARIDIDGTYVMEDVNLGYAINRPIKLDGYYAQPLEIPSDITKNSYLWDVHTIPQGTILIRKGEKIAQLVFAEVIRPLRVIVGKVGTEHDRGGGFGHSGIV